MKKGIKLIDNSSNEYQLGGMLKELINDTMYSQLLIATGYRDLLKRYRCIGLQTVRIEL